MADVTPSSTPKSYSSDSTLYIYTSLTAGSSHIITATSRLETILKANRIPFKALDVATDEKARMLWGRRSKGRKLPGLVRYGNIVGDLEEIEEWNEYGELKQQISSTPAVSATPVNSASNTPSKVVSKALAVPEPASTTSAKDIKDKSTIQTTEAAQNAESESTSPPPSSQSQLNLAMRQLGAEAAKKAGEKNVLKRETLSAKTDGETLKREAEMANAEVPVANATDGRDLDGVESKAVEISEATIAPQDASKNTSATVEETAKPVSGVLRDKEEPSKTSEIAMSSASSLQPDDSEGTASSHRGSFAKADVPKTAIEEVEKAQAIPEVEEHAEKAHVEVANAPKAMLKKPTLSPGGSAPISGKGSGEARGQKASEEGSTQIASSSEAEASVDGETRTQDQDAKKGDAATASVGD